MVKTPSFLRKYDMWLYASVAGKGLTHKHRHWPDLCEITIYLLVTLIYVYASLAGEGLTCWPKIALQDVKRMYVNILIELMNAL